MYAPRDCSARPMPLWGHPKQQWRQRRQRRQQQRQQQQQQQRQQQLESLQQQQQQKPQQQQQQQQQLESLQQQQQQPTMPQRPLAAREVRARLMSFHRKTLISKREKSPREQSHSRSDCSWERFDSERRVPERGMTLTQRSG